MPVPLGSVPCALEAEAMEADLVRVVHKRVAVRASASTSAEIIGVEAKGAAPWAMK